MAIAASPAAPTACTDIAFLVFARAAAASGEAVCVRRAAGLSQVELAALIGVTPSCLCRWEGGGRVPRSEAGARWGNVLHVLREYVAARYYTDVEPAGNGLEVTTSAAVGDGCVES